MLIRSEDIVDVDPELFKICVGIGVGDARLVALVAVVGHRSPVYCHSLAPRAGFSTGPYPREVVILTG